MTQLSATSLMLAAQALNREIRRLEAKLRDEDLSDDDSDYYGNYILDLTKALSEVASAYEVSRQADATLPSFDQLLHDPS